MKRLLFSLVAIIAVATTACAQDDLVATLSHGSTLSTFTGIDALAEAYAAAEEGDVITLSPGVFNAVNIEKAITVRGAGMQPMESNGYVSTQLSGQMVVNVPSGTSATITLEGLQILGATYIIGSDLASVSFISTRFESGVEAAGVNAYATSCIFSKSLIARHQTSTYGYNTNGTQNTIFNCYNCVMAVAGSGGLESGSNYSFVAKIEATNCILRCYSDLPYSNLTNCIIISAETSYPMPLAATCNTHNCVGINSGYTPELFENIVDPSNTMTEDFGIFKTLTWLGESPAFTETYELTETAAATYLGDDGTQVGVYGGTSPFNPTPTNPQVKKFTVNSTTVGDQLKVSINVE